MISITASNNVVYLASNVAALAETKIAASAAGIVLIPVEVRVVGDFDPAFAAMMRERPDAILVSNDPFHQLHIGRTRAIASPALISTARRSRLISEILDVSGMDNGVEQQSQRIYQNMALLALDLFARIIAMRIDAGPPFSALFTLWLSMMAAVGLASRSACSRHAT